MRPLTSVLLAGVSLIVAAPAFAASIGSASIDYSLSFMNFDDVLVSVENGLTTDDTDSTGAGRAETAASVSDLSGSISAVSEANGVGTAEAIADASTLFTAENLSDTPITYMFDLTYTISAEVDATFFSDTAFAFAGLTIFDDFGDLLFDLNLSFNELALGQDTLSGTERFELSLGAFDFTSIEVFAEVSTAAVSAIPVPAAGWLLLGGLGGLAALRKREA
jgi:hypothetical protein